MPKINPAILTWARESAGLDVESAARAIGLGGANAAAHRANESETFNCLKFTLEGAGERSDGNA